MHGSDRDAQTTRKARKSWPHGVLIGTSSKHIEYSEATVSLAGLSGPYAVVQIGAITGSAQRFVRTRATQERSPLSDQVSRFVDPAIEP